MYVFMYVCMYVFMYSCLYICMYVCIYVCMYACICVYMYVCVCTYVRACVRACVCVCVYITCRNALRMQKRFSVHLNFSKFPGEACPRIPKRLRQSHTIMCPLPPIPPPPLLPPPPSIVSLSLSIGPSHVIKYG